MNNFSKRKKILFAFMLSVIMLLAMVSPAYAAGEDEPFIKINFNPFAVVAVVAAFIVVLVLLISAFISVNRIISGSRTRIKRLSKIETEETVQLYDELNEAKWDEDVTAEEAPRKVLLEDEFLKNKTPVSSAPEAESTETAEPKHHGPVPERDMPGYVPPTSDAPAQPVSYGDYSQQPPVVNQSPYAPHQDMNQPYGYAQTPPMQQPVQQPYAYAGQDMSPRVYRPDSDVEIIMRDDSAPAQSAETPVNLTYTESAAPEQSAVHKVRAYRRRGKVPSLVTGSSLQTSPDVQTDVPTDSITDKYDGIYIPNTNFRHMSIFPTPHTVYRDAPDEQESAPAETYTLQVNAAPATEPEQTEAATSPILDSTDATGEVDAVITRELVDTDEIATVEVIPPRRAENEKVIVRLGDDIVDGKLMRTLEDVMEELEDGPVIELEAAYEPAYEEELIFLGSDTVTLDTDDESSDDDGEARMFINGEYVLVHYRTSFMSRFIQTEERIQDYYSVVKNILLSYNDVKSRISWSHESFSYGKTSVAKLNVKGKTLVLYLALDPLRYEGSKYKFTDVSSKPKYEKTPMKLKIRSDRALKYALELVVDMMAELGVPHGEMPDIDYRLPYETVDRLIDRGLVKVVLPSGMKLDDDANVVKVDVSDIVENTDSEPVAPVSSGTVFEFAEAEAEPTPEVIEEPAPEAVEEPTPEVIEEPAPEVIEEPAPEAIEEPAPEVIEEPAPEAIEEPAPEVIEEPAEEEFLHVNAIQADALISDEEAEASIEIVERDSRSASFGKMCEVNLDTVCNRFDDGETVTLEELKKRRLVPMSAARVKILARGVMTKRLTVIADKFSLQAVKMITLAGGHAEQIK